MKLSKVKVISITFDQVVAIVTAISSSAPDRSENRLEKSCTERNAVETSSYIVHSGAEFITVCCGGEIVVVFQ